MARQPVLSWPGMAPPPSLAPPARLVPDPDRSHRPDDAAGNRLIRADSLPALLALEAELAGKVRCIYIDPPFNTLRPLTHYADTVGHGGWLTLMRDRLLVLHRLLSPDGTLFVHIDDNEIGYLIVLLDGIFGRANRLHLVTFKQGSATGHKAINPGCVSTTNFILVYARDRQRWRPHRLYTGRGRDRRYARFVQGIDRPCAEWRIVPLASAFASHAGLEPAAARRRLRRSPELLDRFVLEHAASVVRTARPDYGAVSKAAQALIDRSKAEPGRVFRLERDGRPDLHLIAGERILFYADKLKPVDGRLTAGEPLTTLWDDIPSNNLHQEGGVAFGKGKKPELLLKRLLDLATDPGDLVLDCFAGSGTTGAVAHKMGRRWVMIESGAQCETHILPRLCRVVDGRDPGGITAACGWQGGGGFHYLRLDAEEFPAP